MALAPVAGWFGVFLRAAWLLFWDLGKVGYPFFVQSLCLIWPSLLLTGLGGDGTRDLEGSDPLFGRGLMKLVEMFLPACERETGNGAGNGLICLLLKGRGCGYIEEFRVGPEGVGFLCTTGCFLDGPFIVFVLDPPFIFATTGDLKGCVGFLPLVA